jgi:hypothetical protein
MKYRCVAVAEGGEVDRREFDTRQEMDSFMEGFLLGASCYGAGDVGVYVLKDLELLKKQAENRNNISGSQRARIFLDSFGEYLEGR